ncbi:arylsulfatase [Persicobacter psychrovividus]|uniref:N-acetylgalactosamine-6-sulfatase n=1 Tax=Persicobacter psychrovividus TaxID=387638 RepID=A0ABN6LL61_9BACT|nr:N-acetylgalactosamine-6-sulfatase [Persicobacter psychrovividus]
MNSKTKIFVWGAIIAASLSACQQFSETQTKPNVIIVMTDDQGYGDLACLGNEYIKTPNIDQLYNQSTHLTNFHVAPTCAPTRAGLLTGRGANKTGVWHTVMGRSILFPDEVTLSQVFKENGYKTAMFGKWHLGDNSPYLPQDRGFDLALYHGGGGVGQTPDYWGNDYYDDTYFRNGVAEKQSGHSTDVWFDEAISFIKENKDQPFFCYLSTNAPHSPLNVDSKYSEPYKKMGLNNTVSRFYGLITQLDERIGDLRDELDQLNITKNTIFIFMTDNGTAFGASFDKDGNLKSGYNAGMRGTKCSAYEGGHRVPFFIHWPNGNMTESVDMNELTANTDIMPSLIKMCGLTLNQKIDFDGTDIFNASKQQLKDRVLITDSQRIAIPEKYRESSTMWGNWRLIGQHELYDLSTDPGQLNNIADKHPKVMAKLTKAYDEWWADLESQFEKISYITLSLAKPVVLTAHDWFTAEEAGLPWNQNLIRKGIVKTGHWKINVTQAGEYEIALRRWPKETHLKLNDQAPVDHWEFADRPAESVQYQMIKASLQLNEKKWVNDIQPDSQSANFKVYLEVGNYELSANFETSKGQQIGAYYVYAQKSTSTKSF